VDISGELIDECLISIFRAPHSYTGEDSVEISCHGSRYITNKLLELLVQKGCRMAEPGEFTKRAYLNGKMDLSQAEAVADLIASTNAATHKMALSQLRGNFSSELTTLRGNLLRMTSLLELELDFSDHEDLEFADRSELLELANNIDNKIQRLAHSFETGNAVKQGIPVAIIGKTNVGKSTLLNHLVGEEKAIVSEIHGTTRDVIEDTTVINGVTFRFIDTAGIRHTNDKIEQLGIERTYKKLREASIIIWLIDEVPTSKEVDDITQQTQGKSLIIVRNKIDKSPALQYDVTLPHTPLPISAKHGQGLAKLEEAIYQAADIPAFSENDVIVTSARHYEALTHAANSIRRVIDGLHNNLPGDLLAEDLRLCINHLSDITGGQITPQEALNNIFQHFCVGK
jgi:tRNA modification GTPase